jgi:hypothetical protein
MTVTMLFRHPQEAQDVFQEFAELVEHVAELRANAFETK